MNNRGTGIVIVLIAIVAVVVVGTMSYYTWKQNEETEGDTGATDLNLTRSETAGKTAPPTEAAFSSSTLALAFDYTETYAERAVIVEEAEDTIYVHTADTAPSDGQFVRVFTKERGTDLKTAIKQQFLADVDTADCFVETPYTYAATRLGQAWETAFITYPPVIDPDADPFATAEKCPRPYTAANGIAYFASHTDYPTKFFFFNIGQYTIPAGADDPDTGWQETITVTN